MSHLSQTAEYALRAMAELALADPDTLVPAPELSKRAGVPQHYLSKIMRKLVEAKLAFGTKGARGGFRLFLKPKTIRFIDILAAIGEEPMPDHCAFGWGRCNVRAPCPMHPTFSKLNAGVWQWATRTTLAEVRPTSPRRARR